MQWSDSGIIINAKPFGEGKAVITLLTYEHGRCSGMIRLSKQNRGWLNIGAKVEATWKARLETQLGQWQMEPTPESYRLLPCLDCPKKLSSLTSAASLAHILLPESHEYRRIYDSLDQLIATFATDNWVEAYIKYEITLLSEMGYGLDLGQCAVTGQTDDLVAVSPKTGRAVSRAAAEPYMAKLLPLPQFLLKKSTITVKDISDGLSLTGYFLSRFALASINCGLPPSRSRMIDYLLPREGI